MKVWTEEEFQNLSLNDVVDVAAEGCYFPSRRNREAAMANINPSG